MDHALSGTLNKTSLLVLFTAKKLTHILIYSTYSIRCIVESTATFDVRWYWKRKIWLWLYPKDRLIRSVITMPNPASTFEWRITNPKWLFDRIDRSKSSASTITWLTTMIRKRTFRCRRTIGSLRLGCPASSRTCTRRRCSCHRKNATHRQQKSH